MCCRASAEGYARALLSMDSGVCWFCQVHTFVRSFQARLASSLASHRADGHRSTFSMANCQTCPSIIIALLTAQIIKSFLILFRHTDKPVVNRFALIEHM